MYLEVIIIYHQYYGVQGFSRSSKNVFCRHLLIVFGPCLFVKKLLVVWGFNKDYLNVSTYIRIIIQYVTGEQTEFNMLGHSF